MKVGLLKGTEYAAEPQGADLLPPSSKRCEGR